MSAVNRPIKLSEDRVWLGTRLAHGNNFNLIRLFAALVVAVQHSVHYLYGPAPWLTDTLQYFPGVPIFFFLSGMLVTSSMASSKTISSYMGQRARRIFPALWATAIFSIIVLILFGQIRMGEITNTSFLAWLASQVSIFQVYNPSFLRDFGVGVVNGSLWTIPVEVGFYLMLPLAVYLAGHASNPRKVFLWITIVCGGLSFAAYSIIVGNEKIFLTRLLSVTLIPHFWFFAGGVLAYMHFHWLYKLVNKQPLLFPILYFVFIVLFRPHLPDWLALFFTQAILSMVVLTVGVALPEIAKRLFQDWDISYGLYLIHMPIVNIFVELKWMGIGTATMAIAVSMFLAALSWKFLERPILKVRHKLPSNSVSRHEIG